MTARGLSVGCDGCNLLTLNTNGTIIPSVSGSSTQAYFLCKGPFTGSAISK